jgi:hypothetical protein
MSETKPLHHMNDAEFQHHLNEKYGPVMPHVGAEAVQSALAMSDEEWEAHQNERYPGTKEIIEARRDLLSDIEAFVAPDAPAAKLFERFDASLADETDSGRRLEAYERICLDNFNFRLGPNGEIRERQDIDELLKKPREQVGAELWDTTFDVCREEGMVDSIELHDHDNIKAIAVLGGAPAAIANRTRYALEQIKQHNATIGSFDFTISEGPEADVAFKQAELQLGVDLGQEVSREERTSGTVVTFGPVEINGRQVPVRVLITKSNIFNAEGKRQRATTLDTMKFWGEVEDIHPDDRMVAVTTGLYTAFQNANAREVLTWENGAIIDVIGHSAEWAGGERFANQLLQEYKAAVDSKYRLYQKAIDTGLVTRPNMGEDEA